MLPMRDTFTCTLLFLHVLVGTLLFALATASQQPLLLVVDWSQLSDNTRGGVIHHHHPISFFIICFKIRLSIIILTMTNLIITRLSHIFQSAKSWHSISKYSENWSLKCQCTCTAPNSGAKLKRQPYKTSARQDKNPIVKAVKSKAKGKKSLGVSYKGRWCREER